MYWLQAPIVAAGGMEAITAGMRAHPGSAAVIKNACVALWNMSVTEAHRVSALFVFILFVWNVLLRLLVSSPLLKFCSRRSTVMLTFQLHSRVLVVGAHSRSRRN